MINDEQTWTRNASTAAPIDRDGSSYRLGATDRGMFQHNVFSDVSDKAGAPTWSVSVNVHGSER